MKKILIILILLVSSIITFGQKPEPVYSFALTLESPEWYRQQTKLWKEVIDKEPQNGLAWYNYYYATRNLHRTDTNDKRAHEEKAKEMQALIDKMAIAIPNTYEYHLCMWKEHANDPEYAKHLKKVYELGPDRIEHIDMVINDGEFERNTEKKNEALIKKWEAGLVSPGMANYNRNVLAGVSEGGILVTVGDNDTYPAWYVQATGFRSDVYVINLYLLMIDSYRNTIFKELGIAPIKINWEAKSEKDPDHVKHFYSKVLPALTLNKQNRDVYLGLTAMDKSLVEGHEEQLYLTGLTYKYDTSTCDERALLKRNFEHRYALDYLMQSYYADISSGLVPQINLNYIVPMLKLYEHYQLSGDKTRLEWLKPMLLKVSAGTYSEAEVKAILK